jgi:uncharacterized integral membrane protein
MKTAHLTDKEIQLYAAEPDAIMEEQKAHVLDCLHCQRKAANYAVLFKGIQDTARPTFDFDLSTLVMEQLPARKSAYPWTAILVSILSVLIVGVSAVLFWASMLAVIKSVSIVILGATTTGAVVIMIFQATEMLKSHYNKMNAVLRTHTVQL